MYLIPKKKYNNYPQLSTATFLCVTGSHNDKSEHAMKMKEKYIQLCCMCNHIIHYPVTYNDYNGSY